MTDFTRTLDFTDLPDVLIEKVVQELDSNDIIKLLSNSKKVQDEFKGNYHIVHDNADDSIYNNLPKDLHTNVMDKVAIEKLLNFKGTLLLEVHQMEQSWLEFFDLINGLSEQTTCRITIYGVETIPYELQEHFHRVVNLSALDKGFIKSIHLPDITILHFLILHWDPSIFKAPKLNRLILGDCKLVDPGFKINFPQLEELHLEEAIGKGLEIFEIPKTLSLRDASDIVKIENLKSQDLKFLRIEACPNLNILQNCEFPNLNHFEIYDTPLDYVTDLKAPNLINIVLESSSAILAWNKIDAVNLKELTISCGALEQFQNFNTPNIEFAELNLSGQPILESYKDYESPCNALENVRIMILTSCIQILEGLNLTKLDQLSLQDEFYHRLTTKTKFPVLQSLNLCHNDLIQQVPSFEAPQLEMITVIGSFNFISINNIPEAYPSLKHLKIDNCALSTITGIDFPNLETLDIQSDVPNFTLTNCHFANLKQLTISPKANTGISLAYYDHLMKSVFQFTAPKLAHLMLLDMFIKTPFSTVGFPILKELTIFHVEQLELVDSEILEVLDLSKNEGLEKLDMGILPNLIEFYPPRSIDSFTKNALGLEKNGMEKGVESSIVDTTSELLEQLMLR
ncbi:hypothetical protein WICANDRAFT_77985 [Wickerhamomyces anomalus NRRL Y-366-8]|uniref:F-box domain-containing protein n=1 Tax=Wickerhamomyces anomalus (strain ATCC 58044 / CBS 1984 / NCYC 433 / NRRL Y-366-8) TaxID=683960 RepID=A0A1E3P7I8_WICAA|nr:uncharacterized protein WICANDRAFT_77985 [Wickerhamomyces anomalus NRRL Y-366-8]ODQ61353.1 hypothetical protein WICANDRAFT_77985 [Wickerhamomyces anomalus NRRL Y-366-8]